MTNGLWFWAITATTVAVISGVFAIYMFGQRIFHKNSHLAVENLLGFLSQTMVVVAYLCIATVINVPVKTRNGIAMFLVIVLPFRKLAMIVWPWLVPYIAGLNTWFANRVRKYFYPDPVNKTEKASRNNGIVWLIDAVIDFLFLLVGTFFWACKPAATSRISFWAHGLTNLLPQFMQHPIGFFLWALLLAVFLVAVVGILAFLYSNFKHWGNEEPLEKLSPILVIFLLSSFALRKIYGWFFLAYGSYLILSDLLFWAVVALIVLIIAFAVRLIRARRTTD